MLKKKAQAALEYLMTYGWAILVIVIVIAALYALGVFTPKASVPCTPCFSSFAYLDHSYDSGTKNLTLKIRNGPRSITIDGASFEYTNGTTAWNSTLAQSVEPNKDIEIIGNVPLKPPYDLIVKINYTVTDSGLQHTDTATIHG